MQQQKREAPQVGMSSAKAGDAPSTSIFSARRRSSSTLSRSRSWLRMALMFFVRRFEFLVYFGFLNGFG